MTEPTGLQPIVTDAELALLLWIFIAVMQLITVVVVLHAGLRRRRQRRAQRTVFVKLTAADVDALSYGQAVAGDLETYRRGGGRS